MTLNQPTSTNASNQAAPFEYDVLVIGAGAAGVGVATALRHAGVENFGIIDRATVGASFDRWPSETRFITPSFPTNSVGMLDLNSIAIGTSPAFSLGVEHPTGAEFATHLRAVAGHFRLPVCENTEVKKVVSLGEGKGFRVIAEEGSLRAKHVIWAGGEYQYPRLNGVGGSELCRHTATVPSYGDLEGDDFIVVGGYESGIDAAYHLACQGKRVRVFDQGCPWMDEGSEPSIGLAPFSLERMRRYEFLDKVELHPNTSIASISRNGEGYEVVTEFGESFTTSVPPLLAHGFEGSQNSCPICLKCVKMVFHCLTSKTNRPLLRVCFSVARQCGTTTLSFVLFTSTGNALRLSLRLLQPPLGCRPRDSRFTARTVCILMTYLAVGRPAYVNRNQ